MKTVAIVCTNEIVRTHVRTVFDAEQSIVYIDLATMSSTALLCDPRISLIILHLDSFKMEKSTLIEQILSINSKANIFVLSDMPDFAEARQLIEKGAKGYANSRMLAEGLKHAFDSIEYGDIWMPPSFVLDLIKKVKRASESSTDIKDKLSKKEFEVATFVSEGYSNLQIAEAMEITERTVKSHLSAIFDKLGIKDRLSLALMVKSV